MLWDIDNFDLMHHIILVAVLQLRFRRPAGRIVVDLDLVLPIPRFGLVDQSG